MHQNPSERTQSFVALVAGVAFAVASWAAVGDQGPAASFARAGPPPASALGGGCRSGSGGEEVGDSSVGADPAAWIGRCRRRRQVSMNPVT